VTVRLEVRQGEHVLIVGQTQSGKSVIATTIARGFDVGSLVIFDPKSDPDAMVPNCASTRNISDVVRHLPGRICWRPARGQLGRLMADWDRVCSRLLDLAERGYSSTVVVHELADLGDAHRIGPAFRQVITQGAAIAGGPARGGGAVGAILVTQRPLNIPVIARTEMRHVICLALERADDREEIAGYMEDRDRPAWSREQVATFALANDHSWWYRGPDHRLTLHDPVALPH
jgi:energy-coupling factor transporter ATP-binding protein EcfA2